jgi:phosphatidyl-myo-inositol dimannoside synthase
LKLNLLYISHLHPPGDALLKNIGGMQRVSLQLASELGKIEGVNLTLLTNETSWRWIGIKTFWFLLRQYFFLPSVIRKKRIDVVLCSAMATGTLAFFLRRRISVPIVTITHGLDVTLDVAIYQWLLRRVFKAIDGVISVSSATRDECIARGLQAKKSIVLPNGFVPEADGAEQPDPAEAKKNLFEQSGLNLHGIKPGDGYLLLTVGRLIRRKGHEWFIREVLPRVQSKVIYLIIGDGPEASRITAAIGESGHGYRIVTAGRQPEEVLNLAYAAADLFIMPNIRVPGDMEGFGVVLLEANMANTPAIVTDMEGMRDVIKPGVNGYRIAPSDAESFARKIDEVLVNELPELSLKSRQYVYDTFRWDSVARRYVEYLVDIIRK